MPPSPRSFLSSRFHRPLRGLHKIYPKDILVSMNNSEKNYHDTHFLVARCDKILGRIICAKFYSPCVCVLSSHIFIPLCLFHNRNIEDNYDQSKCVSQHRSNLKIGSILRLFKASRLPQSNYESLLAYSGMSQVSGIQTLLCRSLKRSRLSLGLAPIFINMD